MFMEYNAMDGLFLYLHYLTMLLTELMWFQLQSFKLLKLLIKQENIINYMYSNQRRGIFNFQEKKTKMAVLTFLFLFFYNFVEKLDDKKTFENLKENLKFN